MRTLSISEDKEENVSEDEQDVDSLRLGKRLLTARNGLSPAKSVK